MYTCKDTSIEVSKKMDIKNFENHNRQFNFLTYSVAYSSANNAYIIVPVIICREGKTQYRVEEAKI